jgi:hypothetical protein
MCWNYRVIKTLERCGDEVVPCYAIHEVQYLGDNDDHPVSMSPPIIDTTEDIRFTIWAIARALDKPVLEIVGDEVRPWDWQTRPLYEHMFREVGSVPPSSTEIK